MVMTCLVCCCLALGGILSGLVSCLGGQLLLELRGETTI